VPDCLTNTNGLIQSTVLGLQSGALYAVIAIGYTLVYGVLELLNFAHSEIFMTGGFASVFAAAGFLSFFGLEGPQGGLMLVAGIAWALIVAMIAAGIMAVLMERVAYRPLRKSGAPRLAALISAIGVSLVISNAALIRYGARDIQFPSLMETQILFRIGNVTVNNKQLLTLVAAVVLLVFLDFFVERTKTGKGIRAVAQDAETAGLMGVNIDRIIAITFLVGGVLGGAAGMIQAVVFGNVVFNMGFIPGLKAFTAAVLGGIGNIRGAMLGGVLLGLFENYGALCVPQGARWRDVLAFSVLVLVLMIRPTGILGQKVAERA
jgi:branched-chain amino acid transport system permease protein